MRKKFGGLVALVAMAGLVLLADRAQAQRLDAPENVTCEVVDEVIYVHWDEVEGAEKYSVDVEAEYDIDGEIEVGEFSFGTSDRTDEGEMADPNLSIALADLVLCEEIVDEDGNVIDEVCYAPVAVRVKVKALNPGQGRGPQNHPFSEWCEVDLGDDN
jgi:hypothetical protein